MQANPAPPTVADDGQIGPDKRARIMNAARAVFMAVGYANASMDAITREAGVSKATVYAHFGSKAQLFGAMVAEECGRRLAPEAPGTVSAESLPAPAGRPASPVALASAPARGFSLIPQAHAGTLPVPSRAATSHAAIATGGTWGVQVGAFASENLARAAAGQARDAIGPNGTRTAVERVAQGRTTLYRARVIGLSHRNAAEQACDRMRSRGALRLKVMWTSRAFGGVARVIWPFRTPSTWP